MNENFYNDGLEMDVDGYFNKWILREAPPRQLSASPSQWEVWEYGFRCAIHGNFNAVRSIIDIQQKYKKYVLRHCATILLQDIITRDGLDYLHKCMHGVEDPLLIIDYAQILSGTGRLEFVPAMLDQYEKVPHFNESDRIFGYLSDMLEPEYGDLSSPNPKMPFKEYRKQVMETVDALSHNLATKSESPVFKGEVFSVPKLAKYMLQRISAGDFYPELRQKFEASTGIDCGHFYKERFFQPLNAAATLERFLESDEVQHYEEGVRYFFKHSIPSSQRKEHGR